MALIRKDLKEHGFEIDVDDIYTSTAEIVKFIFDMGDVKEIENTYTTDGPEKNTRAIFILKTVFDKNSSINTKFIIEGNTLSDKSKMEIKTVTSVEIEFQDKNDIVYETFVSFYLSHVMQKIENIAEDKSYEIDEKMKKFLENKKHVKWKSI